MTHRIRTAKKAGFSRGFTLIELLVVIAIIAILAALLFPIVGKSKNSGRNISCKSNLKQLITAFFAYAQDHDNYVPLAYGGANAASQAEAWTTSIPPYLGLKSTTASKLAGEQFEYNTMSCPQQFRMMGNKTAQANQFRGTYSMNHAFTSESQSISRSEGPGNGNRTNLAGVALAIMTRPGRDDIASEANVDFVRKPPWKVSTATTPVFMDGWILNDNAYVSWRHYWLDNHMVANGIPTDLQKSYPHDLVINMAFLDGHIEGVPMKGGLFAEGRARFIDMNIISFTRGTPWVF